MKKVLGKKLTKDFEGSYIYYDDEDVEAEEENY